MPEKVKTDTVEKFSTGASANYSGSLVQDVQPIPMGCMLKESRQIRYASHGKFNTCEANKSQQEVGVPLNRCSYTIRHFRVAAGQPGYYDGYGDYHPPVPPQITSSPSQLTWSNPDGAVELRASLDEVQQARYDAYMRLTKMAGDVVRNYMQSVFELKDTKQTLEPLKKFANFGVALGTTDGSLISRTGPKALKRYLRKLTPLSALSDVANAYLWYTFGVAPTVSDVKAFLRDLSKGKLSIKGKSNIVIPKGSVMVQRYSCNPKIEQIGRAMFADWDEITGNGVAIKACPMDYNLPPFDTWYHMPMRASDVPSGKKVLSHFERGCYFAELKNDVRLSSTDQLSNKFNWSCPPLATLWELVPFSFVIDWFVNVGQAIQNLERKIAGVDYTKEFGPIWHSCQTVDDVWYPHLMAGWPMRLSGYPPGDWSTGGRMVGAYKWTAQPSRATRNVSYLRRHEADAPHIPGLHIHREVHAYQISSGMALLTQFAIGLGRRFAANRLKMTPSETARFNKDAGLDVVAQLLRGQRDLYAETARKYLR